MHNNSSNSKTCLLPNFFLPLRTLPRGNHWCQFPVYPSQNICCMDKHVYISFIPPILPPVFKQMATYYTQYSVSVSSLMMSVGEVNNSSWKRFTSIHLFNIQDNPKRWVLLCRFWRLFHSVVSRLASFLFSPNFSSQLFDLRIFKPVEKVKE